MVPTLTTVAVNEKSAVAGLSRGESRLSTSYQQVYHENAAQTVISEPDVLVQLKANIATLEDLHARMRFALSEISYLIKRD